MIQEIFRAPWPKEYYPNLTLDKWCEDNVVNCYKEQEVGFCFIKNNKVAVWNNETLFYTNKNGIHLRVKVKDYKQVIYILEKFWL